MKLFITLIVTAILSGCATPPQQGSAEFSSTYPRCSRDQENVFLLELHQGGLSYDILRELFETENLCNLEEPS